MYSSKVAAPSSSASFTSTSEREESSHTNARTAATSTDPRRPWSDEPLFPVGLGDGDIDRGGRSPGTRGRLNQAVFSTETRVNAAVKLSMTGPRAKYIRGQIARGVGFTVSVGGLGLFAYGIINTSIEASKFAHDPRNDGIKNHMDAYLGENWPTIVGETLGGAAAACLGGGLIHMGKRLIKQSMPPDEHGLAGLPRRWGDTEAPRDPAVQEP